MSKWIDADALITEIETIWDWETVDGITATTALKKTITDIKNRPSIDLVRCGECIYPKERDGFYKCNYSIVWRNADDFCSYGERGDAE